MQLKSITKIDAFLWLTIILATIFRLWYGFFDNPMDNIWSDPKRHFNHGLNMGGDSFSYLDPVGYQLWLSMIFKLVGTDRFWMGCYAGILSAATVWVWYGWLRKSLSNERAALAAFAVLAALPSWIGIYSLFMIETVMLALLGLSLWLSWIAKEKGTVLSYVIAATSWACAIATKTTVMPPFVVTAIWLGRDLFQRQPRPKALLISFLTLSITFIGYLTNPIYTYMGLGDFWLYPAGWQRFNQIYCQSGARYFNAVLLHKDGRREVIGPVESPAVHDPEPLRPFTWGDPRTATVDVTVDLNEQPQLCVPGMKMTLSETFDLYGENFILFFLDESWPDCKRLEFVQAAQIGMRWIWLPLTILAILLMIILRQVTVIEVLFLVTTVAYLLQQATVMEGRFRKPWEGLIVAALASLILSCTKRAPKETP